MLAESAKNQLNERNELKKDKLNKTKIVKKFNKGDIVYALDRYTLPGNTRPLKSKYYPSPCIVLQDRYTTTLIQRMADGFNPLTTTRLQIDVFSFGLSALLVFFRYV